MQQFATRSKSAVKIESLRFPPNTFQCCLIAKTIFLLKTSQWSKAAPATWSFHTCLLSAHLVPFVWVCTCLYLMLWLMFCSGISKEACEGIAPHKHHWAICAGLLRSTKWLTFAGQSTTNGHAVSSASYDVSLTADEFSICLLLRSTLPQTLQVSSNGLFGSSLIEVQK